MDTHSIDCGVLLPETIRPQGSTTWLKTVVLVILIGTVTALVGICPADSLRGTDFPDFYCAARMVMEGHGHQLYDAEAQRQYQARYAGRVGTLYIHPPFEALLYLSVAWLPLNRAYLLWALLNLGILVAGARRLAAQMPRWDWRILLATSLTFVPLLLCLLQGQDSILLLCLVFLAFTDLRGDRASAAGCWLGLGLFKFHLVLPLLLVLLLTGDRRNTRALARGFFSIALALAGLSALVSGWSVFTVYPNFLLHLQQQPFAGIIPQAMANFRGLTYIVFHRDQSPWAIAGVAIFSAAALVKTLRDWKDKRLVSELNPGIETQSEFDLSFANTILFSLLVSYHLNPHDLTLLLLPIFVMLHDRFGRKQDVRSFASRGFASWTRIILLGVLFAPPLHLWTLKAGIFGLVVFPLFFLFLTNSPSVNRPRAATRGILC